jgi:RNA polymerase sigma-70 factor (ECF subfamily)
MTACLPDCSDGELAALALGGRQAAYGELVRRHQGWVHRLVRSHVGSMDEALDVTQASFVAAFAALNRYDVTRPFQVWMSRIVINKCHDWRRRRAVRNFFALALPLGEADGVADDAPLPDQAIGAEQQLAQAMKAIAALPSSSRTRLFCVRSTRNRKLKPPKFSGSARRRSKRASIELGHAFRKY